MYWLEILVSPSQTERQRLERANANANANVLRGYVFYQHKIDVDASKRPGVAYKGGHDMT
jgi:hypothetical protein